MENLSLVISLVAIILSAFSKELRFVLVACAKLPITGWSSLNEKYEEMVEKIKTCEIYRAYSNAQLIKCFVFFAILFLTALIVSMLHFQMITFSIVIEDYDFAPDEIQIYIGLFGFMFLAALYLITAMIRLSAHNKSLK